MSLSSRQHDLIADFDDQDDQDQVPDTTRLMMKDNDDEEGYEREEEQHGDNIGYNLPHDYNAKTYEQETAEMMRTGLINMWPYALRKSSEGGTTSPEKRRRLWKYDEMFETLEEEGGERNGGSRSTRREARRVIIDTDEEGEEAGGGQQQQEQTSFFVPSHPLHHPFEGGGQFLPREQPQKMITGKGNNNSNSSSSSRVRFNSGTKMSFLETREILKENDKGEAEEEDVEGKVLALEAQLMEVSQEIKEWKSRQNASLGTTSRRQQQQSWGAFRGSGRVPPPAGPGDGGMEDYVECPARCGMVIRLRDLKKHKQVGCGARQVTCPMPGCREQMHASDVTRHIKEDCRIAQTRRKLVKYAKQKLIPISCPNGCGITPLLKRQMEVHVEHECELRLLTCPNEGCGIQLPAKDLLHHMTSTSPSEGGVGRPTVCRYLLNRELMLREQKKRKAPIACDLCRVEVPRGQMDHHIEHTCSHRIIRCPWGCHYKMREIDQSDHQKLGVRFSDLNEARCPVLLSQQSKVEKGRTRMLMMECPACGAHFEARHLAQHHREECNNRLIPCRNWECGCHQMIRLRNRALHEKVNHLLRPRPCLAFDGHRALVNLQETDLPVGWTAEFWVLKADVVERTRLKCRVAMVFYHQLQHAKGQIKAWEGKIEGLRLQQENVTRQSKGGGGKGSKRVGAEGDRTASSTDIQKQIEGLIAALVKGAEKLEEAQVKCGVMEHCFQERILAASRSIKEMQRQKHPLKSLLDRSTSNTTIAAADANSHYSAANVNIEADGNGSARRQSQQQQATAAAVMYCEFDSDEEEEEEDGDQEKGGEEGEGEREKEGRTSRRGTKPEGPTSPSSKQPTVPSTAAAVAGGGRDAGSVSTQSQVKCHPLTAEEVDEEEMIKHVFDRFEDGLALAQEIERLANKAQSLYQEKEKKRLKEAKRGESGQQKIPSQKEKKKQQRALKRKESKGLTVEEQISKAIAGQNGWDVVASSDTARLLLEVGERDQVGFSIIGDADYNFSVTMPDNEWTHLAFVTAPPPRKRVQLYVNGQLKGSIDGVSLPLPKKYIGATQRALHGYMQEVRYWGVQRTQEEIQAHFHTLLPINSTQQGLIGWWTMEEGKGAHLYDVTESRFRIEMDSKHVKWSNQIKTGLEPPTPQYREQLVCQIELRRARLVQRARLHFQLALCPNGCKEEIMKKNVGFHMKHTCRHRLILCRWPGCGKSFAYSARLKHEREDCEPCHKRQQYLHEHEERYTRVECSLGCDEWPLRKDFDMHLQKTCPHRLIHCVSCGLGMPANRIKIHEKRDCQEIALVKRRQFLATQKLEDKRVYKRPWTANMRTKEEEEDLMDPDDEEDKEEEAGEEEEAEGKRDENGNDDRTE